MAEATDGKKLSSTTVLFGVLGLIIVVFVLLGLWPRFHAVSEENNETTRLKNEIEIQKLLFPLYSDLVRRAKFEPPKGLPLPKKRKMSREEIGGLSDVFAKAANEAHLELEKVLPQVNSLKSGRGLLPLELTVRGNVSYLPDLLIKLGEMPYIEHVERIMVQRLQTFDILGMRVWLLVD
ncbi:MAG: hypothetical protein HQK55_03400 [Deltaproteobacteria bacterium]|nr:hypothetical protein [Deltaproteobacteria bacterium]